MLGGENQKASQNHTSGYSGKARPAYLEPNSESMQKPIGGSIAIGAETAQKHVENYI